MMEEWIKKPWYIYVMEYYSVIKNEIMPFAATRMDLEIIIQREVKDRYHIILLMGNLIFFSKSYKQTYLQNRSRLIDSKNKLMVTKEKTWRRGINQSLR